MGQQASSTAAKTDSDSFHLSIVVPTLNEAHNLPAMFSSLQQDAKPLEVIVADGGSSDATVAVARRAGAKVLHTARGRGPQQNAAWRAATGNWVLFLHADTQLPSRYSALIHQAVAAENCRQASQPLWWPAFMRARPPRWGCFRTIHAEIPDPVQDAMLSLGVGLRTSLLHAPYGDQAIFVQKACLDELGGFRDWPLLEDAELVSRLRHVSPPAIIPAAVRTSGRRWENLGFWKAAAINQTILLAWGLGVPPDTLARWYYPDRFPK